MEWSSFFGWDYLTIQKYFVSKIIGFRNFWVQDLSQPSIYWNKTKMRLFCPLTSMYVGLLIVNCKYVPEANQVIINRMTMDKDEVAPVAVKTRHSYRLIKEKLDLCLESENVMNQEKKAFFQAILPQSWCCTCYSSGLEDKYQNVERGSYLEEKF